MRICTPHINELRLLLCLSRCCRVIFCHSAHRLLVGSAVGVSGGSAWLNSIFVCRSICAADTKAIVRCIPIGLSRVPAIGVFPVAVGVSVIDVARCSLNEKKKKRYSTAINGSLLKVKIHMHKFTLKPAKLPSASLDRLWPDMMPQTCAPTRAFDSQ